MPWRTEAIPIRSKGKGRQAAWAALFSLLTMASFSIDLAAGLQESLVISPFSAVWAFGMAGLFMGYRALYCLPRPLQGTSFWLLSALFAGIATLAQSFASVGTTALLMGSPAAKSGALLFFIGRVPCYFMGMKLLQAKLLKPTASSARVREEEGWLGFFQKPHGVLKIALILFLCWLPYYVMTFPGTVSNDSITQLKEIFGVKALSAGNPPAQTFLIWVFVLLGNLFHSADLSVALYCLLQGALLSLLLSRMAQEVLRQGAPRPLFWLTLCFFALCPVFPVFAFCIGKDTNFSMAVLYFSLLVLEFIQMPEGKRLSKGYILRLCLGTALVPLLRNAGIYLALICLLLLLFRSIRRDGANRRQWKGSGDKVPCKRGCRLFMAPLFALCTLLLVWAGIYGVAIPLSGATPMPESENYSLPLQQVARVVASSPESLTEEEKAAISRVLPLAEIKGAYNGELSDPIKDLWQADASGEDKRAFFSTWLSMLPKHSGTYFSAFFHNTYGYLLPGYVSSIKPTLLVGKQAHTTEIDGFFSFTVSPHAKGLKAALDGLMAQPFFRLMIAPGLYGWIALFALVALLGSRRRELLLVAVPTLFSLMGCLLSPVNGYFRYAMPLYVCAPLMLTLCAMALGFPVPENEKE